MAELDAPAPEERRLSSFEAYTLAPTAAPTVAPSESTISFAYSVTVQSASNYTSAQAYCDGYTDLGVKALDEAVIADYVDEVAQELHGNHTGALHVTGSCEPDLNATNITATYTIEFHIHASFVDHSDGHSTEMIRIMLGSGPNSNLQTSK